jgi:SNF2 family DNA or RNA helicase
MTFTLPTLLPHQEMVVDWIVRNPKCGVFLTMGGGKSLSTLAALFRIRPAGHMLVVAPVNIARSTWVDEIEKWGFPLRTKSLIVNERDKKLSRPKRLKLYEQVFKDDPTMYFINVDLITDLVNNMPVSPIDGKIEWPFNTVIVDESQTLKSPTGVRFEALAGVSGAITRLIELTGSPTPNGMLDLWSQMFLLDGGLALGDTFQEYQDRYFTPKKFVNNRPINYEPRPGAEDEIHARVKHKVMSAQNTKIPKPPVSIQTVPVVLDHDMIDEYKRFSKDLVIDLASPDPDNPGHVTLTADNAAILYGKQLQFAAGAMYTDDDHNFTIIHEDKLAMADYIIRNNGGSPVLLPYRWQADKAQLLRYLGEAGHDVQAFNGSREMIGRWNAGKIPVMILQPASAGHGLNLQDGGHTILWYSLPDSLEHYQQTNARLARIGQKHPVDIMQLVTKGTRDERMPDMLDRKALVQDKLLTAVALDPFQAAVLRAEAAAIESQLAYREQEDIREALGDLDLMRV